MDYYINPSSLSSMFTLPTAVVDRHLKFAKAEHLKVLLYIMRNMSVDYSLEDISAATDLDAYEIKEALLYWADAEILVAKNGNTAKTESKEAIVAKQKKPTRGDVARRGNEDSKIRFMLRETQLKFGRALKSNESSTLVWLYDDEGLDVSLILLIVQYAVAHNKANIRFIESVALDWVNKGIDNITDADEQLKNMTIGEQAWNVVSRAFGLEKRKPSLKETESSVKWLNEWKMSVELLERAYDECIDRKSKFSFAYVSKILENWHGKGYKTPDDLENEIREEGNDNGIAAYDIDLFEKMVNSKD